VRHPLPLALGLIVLSTLASCSRAKEGNADLPAKSPSPPEAQRFGAIVFLGDSLTAGFGLSESEAVPALIQRHVEKSKLPYRVVNGGRSGDTTAAGLSRLKWYTRDSVGMRVLVVGLGSNDAMRGLPLDAMEKNLRGIVEEARRARPDLKILLWEMKTFPNMGAQYGERYEAVFERVAKETSATLIPFPLSDVAGKPALNQTDGIHPTREGTELVAKRIWATLESHL